MDLPVDGDPDYFNTLQRYGGNRFIVMPSDIHEGVSLGVMFQ